MSTGQTLLTIGAFILLSNILVTFYRLLAESGQTIDSSQAGITATSLATSYMQVAQGLHFDEVTIDSFLTRTQASALTAPGSLGRNVKYGIDSDTAAAPAESLGVRYFDDIDDFHNWEVRDTTMEGTLGYYRARFFVYYVHPNKVDSIVNVQTFVKRLDMLIWREEPPSTDTVRASTVMGYWMFTSTL